MYILKQLPTTYPVFPDTVCVAGFQMTQVVLQVMQADP